MGAALRAAAAALLPPASPPPGGGAGCLRWEAYDNATGRVPQAHAPLFVGNLTAEGSSCSARRCPVWPVQACVPREGPPAVGHRNWGPAGGDCSGGRPGVMHHCQQCWAPPRNGTPSFWLATPGGTPLAWVRRRAGDPAPPGAVVIAPGAVLARSAALRGDDVVPGAVALSASTARRPPLMGNITCERYGRLSAAEFDVATCAPPRRRPAASGWWVWPAVAVAAAAAAGGAAVAAQHCGGRDGGGDGAEGEAARATGRLLRVCAEAVADPRHITVRLLVPGGGGGEDGGGCAEVRVDCRVSAQSRTLIEERVARRLPEWRGRVRLLRAEAARHDPYPGEREEALRAAVSAACAAPVLPLPAAAVSAELSAGAHTFAFADGVRLSAGQRFVIVQRYKGKLRRLRGVRVTLVDDVYRQHQRGSTGGDAPP